jgi:hypothetical protein
VDAHLAHLTLYILTAIAVVVWLVGLRFLATVAREPYVEEPFDGGEPATRLPIRGVVEVDGEPEELTSRAASILAKGSLGQVGPLRIISRTEDSLIFEGDRASSGLARYVRRGAIHCARLGQGRTRIEYALEVPGGRGLLWGGAIFQALGLVAIAVGFWLVSTYVVNAADPGIRTQAVQMVQVCHFLWPPFLFGVLYRKQHGALRSVFDTFVRNLPFCEP